MMATLRWLWWTAGFLCTVAHGQHTAITVRVGRRPSPSTVAEPEWVWGPSVCPIVATQNSDGANVPLGVIPSVRLSELSGCDWAGRARLLGSYEW